MTEVSGSRSVSTWIGSKVPGTARRRASRGDNLGLAVGAPVAVVVPQHDDVARTGLGDVDGAVLGDGHHARPGQPLGEHRQLESLGQRQRVQALLGGLDHRRPVDVTGHRVQRPVLLGGDHAGGRKGERRGRAQEKPDTGHGLSPLSIGLLRSAARTRSLYRAVSARRWRPPP